MIFKFYNKQLIIEVPNKNKGKFRFKEKTIKKSFGFSFPTLKQKFNKNVYLEWQISYDTPVSSSITKTILGETIFQFRGANGIEKCPYELSEFLYVLVKNKLLEFKDIGQLKKEIENYDEFLNKTPKIKQQSTVQINKLSFHSAITELVTYYYTNKDKTYIEIVTQKQQYASGFQAMVYFCIPITCFSNGSDVIKYTSKEKFINLVYCIDRDNSENIINLFKILAMAGQNHKRDVISILQALERGLKA